MKEFLRNWLVPKTLVLAKAIQGPFCTTFDYAMLNSLQVTNINIQQYPLVQFLLLIFITGMIHLILNNERSLFFCWTTFNPWFSSGYLVRALKPIKLLQFDHIYNVQFILVYYFNRKQINICFFFNSKISPNLFRKGTSQKVFHIYLT